MDNELNHWGIKGMKWGIRRFQKKDGSLTPAGKKRYGDDDSDEESKESYEERKARVIKSGSAKEALQFKGDLTPDEMRYIENRIRWEQNMSAVSAQEVSEGKRRADKVFKVMDDVTNYAQTGAKAWNTIANVYNAFSKSDVSLPKIDTNITNGNRKERKAELKEKKKAEEAKKKREEQEAQRETKHKERAEKKRKEAEAKAKESTDTKPKSEPEESEILTGEVIGEGNSSKKRAEKQKAKAEDYVETFIWEDVPTSDQQVTNYARIAQSYVPALLEKYD